MLLDLLKTYWSPAPILIMGVFATAAGISAGFLPETLDNKLPDTIKEAENIGTSHPSTLWSCNRQK